MNSESLKPTWKNTFNSNLIHHGHITIAFNAAKAAGYPFICWNGRVYETAGNGNPYDDTVVLG